MFESKLKNHSLAEIEAAIAKALSDLSGENFEARLHSLEFGRQAGNWPTGSCDMALTLDRVRETPLFSAVPGQPVQEAREPAAELRSE
ncbi:hypothetical protein [Bordetella petrii]|uniref:hypothetical protein n=1 Tax=Bordetella petrii TaxID=94624 RepID=UPI0012486F30|nr:hypothetical protein [Bordetella petrii]